MFRDKSAYDWEGEGRGGGGGRYKRHFAIFL